MRSYLDGMLRYFEFSGRSTRSQYWLFGLFQILITFAAFFGDLRLVGLDPAQPAPTLTLFAVFVHIVPSVTVQVRRLHDIGKSGAWYLLHFVPFGSLVLFYWACLGSEEGSNYYDGPSSSSYTPAVSKRFSTIPQGVRMGSARTPAVSGRSSSQPSEGRFI
jgi:uncharacterized membrane protein YhaH (DUF805 family)